MLANGLELQLGIEQFQGMARLGMNCMTLTNGEMRMYLAIFGSNDGIPLR
jgi:hypothetical protein